MNGNIIQGKDIARLTATIIVSLVVLVIGINSGSEESIRWVIRRTADISFILLFFSFGASALNYFIKKPFTKYLVRNRRYFGISFCICFLSHASLVFVLSRIYPEPLLSQITKEVLYIGITLFSMTAIMGITSNDFSVRFMGRKTWTAMHTLFGYSLSLIFLATFIKDVVERHTLVFAIFAFFAAILFLIRWTKFSHGVYLKIRGRAV